jgi:hypothetical protein
MLSGGASERFPLKRFALPLLLALLAGCATTAPFQAGKPVDVQPGTLSNSYSQDGHPVSIPGLLEGLSRDEVSRNDAIASRNLFGGSIAAGALGVGSLGFGVYDAARHGRGESWAFIAAGVGLSGVSIYLHFLAERRLELAIQNYSRKVETQGHHSEHRVTPWLTGVSAPEGKHGFAVGFQLHF